MFCRHCSIVVVSTRTLLIENRLAAYDGDVRKRWVSEVTWHGSQVWCASHKSCHVVEFDAESKVRSLVDLFVFKKPCVLQRRTYLVGITDLPINFGIQWRVMYVEICASCLRF